MIDLSVIVIAQNEEANIGYCLRSVCGWVKSVFVVDGGSTDDTIQIAESHGAKVAYHPFVDFADQRNWALDNLPITTDWILFLDADEQILHELRHEIEVSVAELNSTAVAAYSIQQAFVFLGRRLAHAHGGPHLIRLVRRTHAHWVCEGPREYCLVRGEIRQLYAQIWHEDQRGLCFWTKKHVRYAQLEVRIALASDQSPVENAENKDRQLRTWIRKKLLPLVPYQIRPIFTFLFRYFVQLGILDGYPGFVFCFLHAFWYPLLTDALVFEASDKKRAYTADSLRDPCQRLNL